jgi:hypothetical protein
MRRRNRSGACRRPFLGKQRRTDARRLEGAPTDMELRDGNNARGGKATVLTVGRRCSHCRLDEDGDAMWVFAAASCPFLCSGVPSRCERPPPLRRPVQYPLGHERSPVAAHRRRRETGLLLPPPPLLPFFHLLTPPRRRALARGKPQLDRLARGGSALELQATVKGQKGAWPRHVLPLVGAAEAPTWLRGSG